MKVGELAKLSGLAPSRIRFYEASGLLKSVTRRANGYREYAPETVWILEIITGAQSAGFSLDEIATCCRWGRTPPGGTTGCWKGSNARSARSKRSNCAWRRTRRNCSSTSTASRTGRRGCSASRAPSGCSTACARGTAWRRPVSPGVSLRSAQAPLPGHPHLPSPGPAFSSADRAAGGFKSRYHL